MNTVKIENKDLPAFACVGYDALGGGCQQDGLSKLEYFTAMAMKGILSNSADWTDSEQATEWVSNAAVKFAVETLAKLQVLNK